MILRQFLLIGLIAAIVACARVQKTPDNTNAHWVSDAKPLEIILQWAGKRRGVTYQLDDRMLRLRIYAIVDLSMPLDRYMTQLQTMYGLTFSQVDDNCYVVHGRFPDAEYRRFQYPADGPALRL